MIEEATLNAIFLTLRLAATSTLILLVLGTPVAWWLARTRSIFRGPASAIVALPLVLPPTVLGFYFLVGLGPQGPIGSITQWLGWGAMTFSFAGLVLASVIYSMPFVVLPIQRAFETIGTEALEAAATLRAAPLDTFVSVVLPMAKRGYLTATVLGFAHTMGEFGVVPMIGGNIPEKTRVVSVQIYDQIGAFEYAQAHWLSACMLALSFTLLLVMYAFQPARPAR